MELEQPGADAIEAEPPLEGGIELPDLEKEVNDQINAISQGKDKWAPLSGQPETSEDGIGVTFMYDGAEPEVESVSLVPWSEPRASSPTRIEVKALDSSGQELYQFEVDDPRWVEIEGQEHTLLDQSPLTLVFRADERLSAVEITFPPTGGTGWTMEAEAPPSITVELGELVEQICAEHETACAE